MQPAGAANRHAGLFAHDDRQGVGIQVIGVFVGQNYEIGPDAFRRERRQREPLEAEEAFGGIGKIRIEINDFAGRSLEDKSRLPQPPQTERTGGHFRIDQREAHGRGSFCFGLCEFLCQNEVARPSWPCFFTGWKPVPLQLTIFGIGSPHRAFRQAWEPLVRISIRPSSQ